MRAPIVLVTVLSLVPAAFSQTVFKNVEIRTTYGNASQGNNGKLVVDTKTVRFMKNNQRDEYFSLPSNAVTELFYSRVSGRRIGAAMLVSPLLLFTKGRKHYLTLSFNDGADLVGAVEFQLHKSNYRGVLRSLEEVTGQTLKYDQEGIKGTAQVVASREQPEADEKATVTFTSEPEGAEIELDGVYIGTTPRERSLEEGEYSVVVRKKGYEAWSRKISVQAGDELTVSSELEEK